MNYDIEFKMIEIKDVTKKQRRKLVKDNTFKTETTQINDITDEYSS